MKSSPYRGVSFNKAHGTWRAMLYINKRGKYLGSFLTPELAALKYNREAIKAFGDAAVLNEVPHDSQV